MSTDETPLHVQQAEGLRALADMIEQNPELHDTFLYSTTAINVFTRGDNAATDMAALIRAGLRAGATVEKEATDDWMTSLLRFGGNVTVAVNATRAEVCERRQVGTEVRKVREYVEVEREVPVFEWDCKPLLAAEQAAGDEAPS